MPVDDRFVTRPYQPGDEAKILDLFERCFGVRRSPEHFRWKYLDNPFGNAHISLTFDRGENLVAQYAGYPVPFVEEGREAIAHHIGDIMTDPAVRQIGLGATNVLARTGFHFYEHFCEGRVAFNYGFNTASHRALSVRYLRATAVEPVSFRTREGPVVRIARPSRWIRGYQLELVRSFGSEFDRLFERAAPSYRFLVRRDARYLRWRYLQCPEPGSFVIAIRQWRRLAGWSAFRIRDRRMVWGDALFDPDHRDAAEVLLRHVVPEYPVDRIDAWFAPRPPWMDEILNAAGFVLGGEPQDLSLMCVPFVFPGAPERMRRSLYYTMGDSDLF